MKYFALLVLAIIFSSAVIEAAKIKKAANNTANKKTADQVRFKTQGKSLLQKVGAKTLAAAKAKLAAKNKAKT